ncbi:hypothetical protein Scep_001750 [Stephania cephalantha]|uniref:Uncharacterized protein n=1 Tax=Stephania cephalantha TaxID=152367 RepID=A0AAP0LCL6_9MAGN
MVQPRLLPNSRLYTTATTLPSSNSISRHVSAAIPRVLSALRSRDSVIFVGLCGRDFDFPKM